MAENKITDGTIASVINIDRLEGNGNRKMRVKLFNKRMGLNEAWLNETVKINNKTYFMQTRPYLIIETDDEETSDYNIMAFLFDDEKEGGIFYDEPEISKMAQFIKQLDKFNTIFEVRLARIGSGEGEIDYIQEGRQLKKREKTRPLSDEKIFQMFNAATAAKKPRKSKKSKKSRKSKTKITITITQDDEIGSSSSEGSTASTDGNESEDEAPPITEITEARTETAAEPIIETNTEPSIETSVEIEKYEPFVIFTDSIPPAEKGDIYDILTKLYRTSPTYKAYIDTNKFNKIKVIRPMHYDNAAINKGLHFNVIFTNMGILNYIPTKPKHIYISPETHEVIGITEVVNIL
jgi:hypothetical protein